MEAKITGYSHLRQNDLNWVPRVKFEIDGKFVWETEYDLPFPGKLECDLAANSIRRTEERMFRNMLDSFFIEYAEKRSFGEQDYTQVPRLLEEE